jgi:hypothetical protein
LTSGKNFKDDALSSSDDSMEEEEKYIYNKMHAEDEDLTSGYTTISSNQSGVKQNKETLGIKELSSHR